MSSSAHSLLLVVLAALLPLSNCRNPGVGFQKFDRNAYNGIGYQKPDDIPGYVTPPKKPKLVKQLDPKFVNKRNAQLERMRRQGKKKRKEL